MRAGQRWVVRLVAVRFGLALTAGMLATSACSDSTDSGTGAVRVTAVTTGPNADASYQVSLDGGTARALTANTPQTFDALTPGAHSVLLTDIAPNCSVGGPNPVTVTVGHGATTNTVFNVACTDAASASIYVTTFTSGPDAPSTFSIGVDSSLTGYAKSATIPANGATTINVPAGTHTVKLVVPGNCGVGGAGGNASVTAAAGSTATLHFDISCTTGAPLRVRATTTGPGAPATFTVSVDAGPGSSAQSATISANGGVTFTLPAGQYTVTLVTPRSCTVATNGTSVTVATGAATDLSFVVTCVAPGKLRVTVGTTGSNLDSAYSVRVDGSAAAPVSSTAGTVFDSVGSGAHAIELVDVASNCTVTGANPATVSVTAGATTDLHFAVACVAYGSLRVSVATTGADVPGSFGVSLEADNISQNVPSNGATFIFLPPGPHTVTLQVPPNCSVTSPHDVTVTVPPGVVTEIAFTVTCVPNPGGTSGTIRVTVTTTGTSAPGSYQVEVDPGYYYATATFDAPPNGTASTAVSPGAHSIWLGVPGGCQLTSQNNVSVTVVSGATVDVAFSVTCVGFGTLHVTVATTGANAPPNYEVTVFPDYVNGYGVVPANGASSISLAPGSHIVTIGAPQNCVVDPAYRASAISAEATTDAAFTVTCQ